jgi:signal peptidase I
MLELYPRRRRALANRIWIAITAVCVIGGLASWILLARVATTYRMVRIPSESMKPTLLINDVYPVNFGAYKNSLPVRGDIIAFNPPLDALQSDQVGKGILFIFRCVGLPGDTIEIRNGKLFRNGNAVLEEYVLMDSSIDFKLVSHKGRLIPASMSSFGVNSPMMGTVEKFAIEDEREMNVIRKLAPKAIPPGHIIVLGDNRGSALDSRMWGLLKVESIAGRLEQVGSSQ